jgi:hypothetical protein
MGRLVQVLGGLVVISAATAAWLYFENRDLRAQLARRGEVTKAGETDRVASADPWAQAPELERSARIANPGSVVAAARPELRRAGEGWMARRARITEEMMALLGRLEGESDEDYRNRVFPIVSAYLEKPRGNVARWRKSVEESAGVTSEQSAKIDEAFQGVYKDVVDYANQAIEAGQLSPYSRNLSGLLEFGGGLGSILGQAEASLGKILTPEQLKAIYGQGFEWGEYLGWSAPWEQLRPPPMPGGR